MHPLIVDVLTSINRVENLLESSVSETCLEFGVLAQVSHYSF